MYTFLYNFVTSHIAVKTSLPKYTLPTLKYLIGDIMIILVKCYADLQYLIFIKAVVKLKLSHKDIIH